MIHAWHKQSPFTNACVIERPNVCPQIEHFPDLYTKHDLLVEFLRSMVQLAVFGRDTGLDVYWAEYRIVSLILYLQHESDSGHYQACILSNANGWMADDGRLPWPSRIYEEMMADCYLFWSVPQRQLASFW